MYGTRNSTLWYTLTMKGGKNRPLRHTRHLQTREGTKNRTLRQTANCLYYPHHYYSHTDRSAPGTSSTTGRRAAGPGNRPSCGGAVGGGLGEESEVSGGRAIDSGLSIVANSKAVGECYWYVICPAGMLTIADTRTDTCLQNCHQRSYIRETMHSALNL